MREAAVLIAGGETAEDAARQIGGSMLTYHRWKDEYSGAKDETREPLKALQKWNQQLIKLVADLSLDKVMLYELVEGKR